MTDESDPTDFSKPSTQELFAEVSPEVQQEIIGLAQEEAQLLQSLIKSGRAGNYTEAIARTQDTFLTIGTAVIRVTIEGDIFMDAGGGESKIGNFLDAAIIESEDGSIAIDPGKVDENMKKIFAMANMLTKDAEGHA